jgi:hypothetical protein
MTMLAFRPLKPLNNPLKIEAGEKSGTLVAA